MINKINNEEFEQVYYAEKAIVVFSAEWCDACHRLLDKLSEANINSNIKIFNVDVDECDYIADENNIRGLPTVITYNHGEVIGRLESSQDINEILDMV